MNTRRVITVMALLLWGALAFLTLGFLGGVPLLLGSSEVWTALLAVQVSLAAILARR